MNDKKRVLLLIIGLFISAIVISGATFAWWTWSSTNNDKTNVIFNVPNGIDQLKAILDQDNTVFDGMYPAETCAGNGARMATVNLYYVNNSGFNAAINATLSLDSISSIHQGTIDQSKVKWALSTTTGNNCASGIIASGNLGGKNLGDTIYTGDLDTGVIPTGTAMGLHKTLYLYFYIDHTYEMYTVSDIGVTDPLQDLSLKVVWNGTITNAQPYEDPSGANAPELTSGMVPVKLNENGTVVTTVDPFSSNEWYNYSESKWANAVLVDSSVRSNYIDSTTGDIIPNVNVDTEKILAYYVWIPRFKYTFADNSTQNPYPEQSIDIVFENKDAPRATGEANGPDDYYTHPAFTWNFTGDTLDESTPNLGGIWVGKFEMNYNSSGTTYSSTSIECTNTTCANANKLRILPNKKPLTFNTISSFFYGIRSMQQSGNSFGLPIGTTTADSHMMKNREWGAVAYLAHSEYGLGNQEVRKNSYYNSFTGCGASTTNTSSNESACYDPYGKTSTTSPSTTRDISTYPQSTTGNITGVFDMSGGSEEYVMGNYNGTTGNANFSSLPVSKYYDKYSSDSNSNCTFAECGGHALKETASWHSDFTKFVSLSEPWFIRSGGVSDNASYAGSFSSWSISGDSEFTIGVRSVVVVS